MELTNMYPFILQTLIFYLATLTTNKAYESLTDTSKKYLYTGLDNPGVNSCFMNSSLQVLMSIDKFVNYFANNEFEDNTLSNAFYEFIKEYNKKEKFFPKKFRNQLKLYFPNLINGAQQDAGEFTETFLWKLIEEASVENIKSEEQFNRQKKNNFILNLFGVLENNSYNCNSCNNNRSDISCSVVLRIINSSSVQDGINNLFINNNIPQKCPLCDSSMKYVTNYNILRVPLVLLISVNHNVEFQSNIDSNTEIYIRNIKYILKGVVYHSGNNEGGHYVSDVLRNDTWIHFDDSHISFKRLLRKNSRKLILAYEIVE